MDGCGVPPHPLRKVRCLHTHRGTRRLARRVTGYRLSRGLAPMLMVSHLGTGGTPILRTFRDRLASARLGVTGGDSRRGKRSAGPDIGNGCSRDWRAIACPARRGSACRAVVPPGHGDRSLPVDAGHDTRPNIRSRSNDPSHQPNQRWRYRPAARPGPRRRRRGAV